ncbi:MAG: glycerophosphodiester phosphodiesterase family protein [Acholeplasmataceae bacterium]|jgi:glycerophosphoryl diester phosphodiesterase|nr:glycerophosphodiester phosphodiesterase family protein [Acholeplasmataceae bacterium]
MKDLTWLKEAYIAHRGYHLEDGSIPENSIKAYKEALNRGYAIELDVNLLKDHTVVAFHDYHLKRLLGIDKNVDELTFQDIKGLTLLNTEEHIPTLKEVLDLVNGQTPLLIELKPHGNVSLLVDQVMNLLETYKGPYAIFSFHPKVVYLLKKNYPQVIRGQIAESFRDDKMMSPLVKKMMKHMLFNPLTKPDFISYGIRDLPNKQLDRLKRKGLTIISYAARTQNEFDLVKKHYHNVVFEYFEPKKKDER